jgi:hypothetical protein
MEGKPLMERTTTSTNTEYSSLLSGAQLIQQKSPLNQEAKPVLFKTLFPRSTLTGLPF